MYKILGSNIIFGDILQQVLENRNIKDQERFKNPSPKDIIPFRNLKNIDKAVEIFDKHKGGGSTVTVIVDSDCD